MRIIERGIFHFTGWRAWTEIPVIARGRSGMQRTRRKTKNNQGRRKRAKKNKKKKATEKNIDNWAYRKEVFGALHQCGQADKCFFFQFQYKALLNVIHLELSV